jgi:hypothetical protein
VSIADLADSAWPARTSPAAVTSGDAVCSFQFEHRVTIEHRPVPGSPRSNCEFEYHFVTFDAGTRRKSPGSHVFTCLKHQVSIFGQFFL